MRTLLPRSVRRAAVAVLLTGLAAGLGCSGPAPTSGPSIGLLDSPLRATRVGPIGITVSDLERATEFYTGVLRFEPAGDVREELGEELERRIGVFGARTRTLRLRLGREEIELTQYLAPEGRPIPADSRSNDGWFQHIAIVVSDIDRAYAVLREHHVRHASTGPQTLPAWNKNAAGIAAFYFKDPDGHILEVIRFPPGKGDPRWQSPAGGLFLGIDHTAIVTRSTARSLAFYRDRLGLRVAGGSENSGTEQEHLNNVRGARLRITTLRADAGPGVELLEYLSPGPGRPMPQDAAANDLWHWHTLVEAPGADGRLTLDPDGHAVLAVPPVRPADPSGIERAPAPHPGADPNHP